MGVFIPTHKRKVTPARLCYCQWCGQTGARAKFYKLRDGPLDWWFCNDDHALEWLDYRHRDCSINAFLKLTPSERRRITSDTIQR